MNFEQAKNEIACGQAVLGIEFGSTRIKAVAIGSDFSPLAQGSFEWENRYEGGYWTYRDEEIWEGLRACYADLKAQIRKEYGITVKAFSCIGFSAMMHGYLPFDQAGNLLTPFRTWRNSNTTEAAGALIRLFDYNIPERWGIAHLYQAILNGEAHVPAIDYITTLAGYVHWKLTGEKVLGIGDASGIFPIDSEKLDYDARMLAQFDELTAEKNFPRKLREILPKVLKAGEEAGHLTKKGAMLLDPEGDLADGILLCPPEGDAGTGMTATCSVAERTGNVSAGTSVFAMIVLQKALSRLYPQIDMVTTPSGEPVAMVHANNCTSDINAWAGLFRDFAARMGMKVDKNQLFTMLYQSALDGDADCGGLLSYGFFSGEFLAGLTEGRPMLIRQPDSRFSVANLMKTSMFSALGAIKLGLEILEKEQVQVDSILGHGGFFKTKGVGQKMLAAAMKTDISVMETAGEGGAWGMALLAAYAASERRNGLTLGQYLEKVVFAGMKKETVSPDPVLCEEFETFMERFRAGMEAERAAVQHV